MLAVPLLCHAVAVPFACCAYVADSCQRVVSLSPRLPPSAASSHRLVLEAVEGGSFAFEAFAQNRVVLYVRARGAMMNMWRWRYEHVAN